MGFNRRDTVAGFFAGYAGQAYPPETLNKATRQGRHAGSKVRPAKQTGPRASATSGSI